MIDIHIDHAFSAKAGGFQLSVSISACDYFVAFFGHSGSGKTLTMQAVSGLFTPRQGRIEIRERTVFDSEKGVCLPARLRRLGYLFQDYALFPHLTVRQNIAFALDGGRPVVFQSKATRRRVAEMLDGFEIGHIADQRPGRISGGQKQRVALARALANRPDLLLLDEPFSALDPLMRGRVRSQCRDLLIRFSTPTIIITHDPADVAAFAQSVVLFEDGLAHVRIPALDLPGQKDSDDELLSCLATAVASHPIVSACAS